MYKRETSKQFERRLRQMNAEKRLTKNQRLWEEEARKLRNRLAAAEKKGYGFADDIVPQRPAIVRKKDIEALRKIKGKKVSYKSEFLYYDKLKSGKNQKLPYFSEDYVYLGRNKEGQWILTQNAELANSDLYVPVKYIDESLHSDIEDPERYLQWAYPSRYDPDYLSDGDNYFDWISDREDTDDTQPAYTESDEQVEETEVSDPQERYYQENPERGLDNTINVDIGEAVIENAYSLIETQAGEIDTWDVSNNIKEIKRDAGSRLKSLLDGAISVFGRRTVAYNLQNFGAEIFTQYVERALFYVAAYSDSATDMVTNAALGDIRNVLFKDDPGMAASYDFEDYDNV